MRETDSSQGLVSGIGSKFTILKMQFYISSVSLKSSHLWRRSKDYGEQNKQQQFETSLYLQSSEKPEKNIEPVQILSMIWLKLYQLSIL